MQNFKLQNYLAQRLKARQPEIVASRKTIKVSIPEELESDIVTHAHRLRTEHDNLKTQIIIQEEKERYSFIQENERLGHFFKYRDKPKRRKWDWSKLPMTIACQSISEAQKLQNNALAAFNTAKKRNSLDFNITTKIEKDNHVSITKSQAISV